MTMAEDSSGMASLQNPLLFLNHQLSSLPSATRHPI